MNTEGYSFSTCWNIKKHINALDMIEEIRQIGFNQVELNYNVTQEMFELIFPLVEQNRIGVSSVHNVFPFVNDPTYDTDSIMLGFIEKEKRGKSVQLLKQSVDYAARLGAKGVVVHPGEIPFSYNIDSKLKEIYHSSGIHSQDYQQLWTEMITKRETESSPFLKRIENSLEEVSEYIQKKQYDIGIGIETRSRCYQIPTLSEAVDIMDHLAGAPVYLWYDIGHAMMMEEMGLYDSLDRKEEWIGRLLGVHIHETIDLSDHWCPYVHSNHQHFDKYIEVITAAKLKVYELKAACTSEEIQSSHQKVMKKVGHGA